MFSKIVAHFKSNEKFHKLLNIALALALAFYIFSIPAFSARSMWNYVSYFLMAACAGITLIEYILYERFYFDKRLLLFVFFIIEAFVGTIIYSHEFRLWLSIVLVSLSLVVFYYAFKIFKNQQFIFIIIAYSLLAFGAYFAFVYRSRILSLRISGGALGQFFDNPNTIGTYFSIGTALFIYLALFNKNKLNLLYLVPALGMVYLGIFTGSRHFLITTIVTGFTALFLSFRKRKWIAIIILAATCVLMYLVIQTPQMADFKERINRSLTTLFGIGNSKFDPSSLQRTLWPLNGINLGSKELLFGYGTNGFSTYSGIGTYAHNNYAEVICNFGIIGLITFYFPFLYSFFLVLRKKDRSKYFVLIIVIFYLTKGFFGVYYASKDAYMMIALCYCLISDVRLGTFKSLEMKERLNNYCEVNI